MVGGYILRTVRGYAAVSQEAAMPTPRPVRCALIGTKNIAAQHIPVLQALPEAEVAALCDIDSEAVGEMSRRFGVEQTFTSVDDLQAWGEFDAVYVLVSVLAVAKVAERFIRAGTPTFLEKPPGLYSSDTERLAQAVRETGTTAMVGLNRRFYTCLQAGREALLDTGDVVSVTVHADEAAGDKWFGEKFPPEVSMRWAYANSIHALDLLRYLGGDVKKVTSVVQQRRLPKPDSFSALLEYESGAVGRAIADHFGPKGNGHSYEARTATAVLTSSAGPSPGDRMSSCVLERSGREPVKFRLTGLDQRLKPGFPGESRAFLRAVQAGEPVSFPAPTLDDAVLTMKMIDEITGAESWAPKPGT
jgi:predicted dehydrogenase